MDPLSIYLAGGLVERFPELTSMLDRWSIDDDFWVRRSAMLALLIPLRQREGDFDRLAGTPTACWKRKSSLFERRSAGCCAR